MLGLSFEPIDLGYESPTAFFCEAISCYFTKAALPLYQHLVFVPLKGIVTSGEGKLDYFQSDSKAGFGCGGELII